jgi:hypothetical protein
MLMLLARLKHNVLHSLELEKYVSGAKFDLGAGQTNMTRYMLLRVKIWIL